MQVHLITLVVEDHEGLGADEIKAVLEYARYPNRCIAPYVTAIETRDIGEWHDGHPLNKVSTRDLEVQRLFGDAPKC